MLFRVKPNPAQPRVRNRASMIAAGTLIFVLTTASAYIVTVQLRPLPVPETVPKTTESHSITITGSGPRIDDYGDLLNQFDPKASENDKQALTARLALLSPEEFRKFLAEEPEDPMNMDERNRHRQLAEMLSHAFFKAYPDDCLSLLRSADYSLQLHLGIGIQAACLEGQSEAHLTALQEFVATEPPLDSFVLNQLRGIPYLLDPDAFEEALAEGSDTQDIRIALHWYSNNKSEHMRRLADAFFPQLPPQEQLRRGVFVSSWMASDPDGALAWLLEQSPEVRNHQIEQGMMRLLGQGRFLEVLPLLERVGDTPLSAGVRAKVASELAFWKGPDEGFLWLKETNGGGEEELKNLAYNIAGTDPEWLIEHESEFPPFEDGTMDLLTMRLLTAHPDLAFRWAADIDDAEKRTTALQRLFGTLAHSDPQKAVEAFNAFPEELQTTDILRSITSTLGKRDWRTAEEFALTNANSEEEKTALLGSALAAGIRIGSTEASESMSQFLVDHPDDPAAISAARTLVGHQFWIDRESLIATIEKLPEGGARDQAVGDLAATWAPLDPIQTSEWMAELPQIPDKAIASLVPEIRNDLAASLAWSSRLENPETQSALIEKVVSEWWQIDPDYTTQILNESPVDPKLIQNIMTNLPRP